MGIIIDWLFRKPAEIPTAPCGWCGVAVDTREVSEGGSTEGCELSTGVWACSPEHFNALQDTFFDDGEPEDDEDGVPLELHNTLIAIAQGYLPEPSAALLVADIERALIEPMDAF
jgi:hypothetical protein